MTRFLRYMAPVCAAALLVAASCSVRANDRPYISARTAVAEDDEQVWSVDVWATRIGPVRSFSVEPDYAITTTSSAQVEFRRQVDRNGVDSGSSVEFDVKHLFNQIARDGWAWGLNLAQEIRRAPGQGWQRGEAVVKLPLSVKLWEGDGLLHANLGMTKEPGLRRELLATLAVERELWRRSVGFVEISRQGDTRLYHGGMRYWIKKERLVVDFSLLQQRQGSERASGFVIGLGWYDL